MLRYLAIHREKINTLYRLTPVDAYQMGRVKQISVSSNTIGHDFNKPYIRLLSVSMDERNGIGINLRAKIELDIKKADGTVERKTKTIKTKTIKTKTIKTKTIKTHEDLFQLSGERAFYESYVVHSIDCTPGKECLEFTNQESIELGKAIGAIDESLLKRA